MIVLLANFFLKGYSMKLGSDFWFWVRLLIEVLKAILGFKPPASNPAISTGERMFNAALAVCIEENEDDKKKASDLQALVRT